MITFKICQKSNYKLINNEIIKYEGIPVQGDDPDMKNKVFYVWFEASIGYISITSCLVGDDWKKWWQNRENVKLYQFIGKDNVTFYKVIFPSTLICSK